MKAPTIEVPMSAAITNVLVEGDSGGNQRLGRHKSGPANGIPDNGNPTTEVWTVIQIPVAQIGPNPFQPRLAFEAEEMSDLIASVKAHGVLQPVTVRTAVPHHATDDHSAKGGERDSGNRRQGEPLYHLIAGERRLRASRAAGRKTIPAIVRDDLSDRQAAELAVVENVQRANLSVIEEARAYKRLMVEFRMKEERIAKKVGKSVQVVRDTLKLLALPEPVQAMLAGRKLTASHGQLLLKLAPFKEICTLVATHVEGSGLTATALGQNLLPNARQLRDKKLVAELDYRTKFDWKEVCGNCPHKAYFTAGYASYCAKPEEWQRKQTEAIELRKLEAARVLEDAKSKEGAVDISVLPSGSYRDLTFAQIPAGCSESCACRSSACLPHDPARPRAVCLNPERYDELVQAHRQAIAEARRRRYLGFYLEAKTLIAPNADVESEEADSGAGLNTNMSHSEVKQIGNGLIDSRLTGLGLSLVIFTILCGDHLNYRGREKWDQLCREVADESGVELPWERWQSEEVPASEVLAVLRGVESEWLVRFAANLLMAQEALQAIHYGGETPLLSAVLGHESASQVELEAGENESDEDESNDHEGDNEAADALIDAVCEADMTSREGDMAAGEDVNFMHGAFDGAGVDGSDFEGEEFEDERFHVQGGDIQGSGIQANEPRSFEDEPYRLIARRAA